ncbi:hypothetical protein DPMN_159721 [Dreissena polymorpha]|uniref:Uncharacterized protein n=1 Tax=Dreissena polymorpha TaxID=45954 RepID=A0A9D4ELZ3_DREPO|nr:hypothetical protein DPMN_159721 [Dreissena polymorpha]
MFQREPRTRLPDVPAKHAEMKVDEDVRQNDARAKAKNKAYFEKRHNARENDELKIGDRVLVANEHKTKCSSRFNPETLIVEKRKGNMITAKSNKKEVTRNASFFKKTKIENEDSANSDDDDTDDIVDPCCQTDTNPVQTDSNPVQSPRRTERTRREPAYLKDYVK